jgi:hypothetical protein
MSAFALLFFKFVDCSFLYAFIFGVLGLYDTLKVYEKLLSLHIFNGIVLYCLIVFMCFSEENSETLTSEAFISSTFSFSFPLTQMSQVLDEPPMRQCMKQVHVVADALSSSAGQS